VRPGQFYRSKMFPDLGVRVDVVRERISDATGYLDGCFEVTGAFTHSCVTGWRVESIENLLMHPDDYEEIEAPR
jgi:hypothetical protein